MSEQEQYIRWFEDLGSGDVAEVGGKNASLGEMVSSLKEAGIEVPEGFATTSNAYWAFLKENGLKKKIQGWIDELSAEKKPLHEVGKQLREAFVKSNFPKAVEAGICDAYRRLSSRYDRGDIDVAVRSSATAEDLPSASFAGQQETYLNVSGEEELLWACKRCYASLFTDRAISYRQEKGFDHMEVALSIGIQKMVRSDKAGSGVMFSIDTETGFPGVVVINAAWGLGENVVQGTVTPDEYKVFKPLLEKTGIRPIVDKILGSKEKQMIYTEEEGVKIKNIDTPEDLRNRFVLDDQEVIQLAKWAQQIEKHYETPMDIEWAKDGQEDKLYIVQARPETVQSQKQAGTLKSYVLKEEGKRLLSGISIGSSIVGAKACMIKNAEDIGEFEENTILVTQMTDPDWVPIMKRAAGIITDHGGRTCHAAIVSRELGIPAIVGTDKGTALLKTGQEITLSCAEGDQGYVYEGILDYETTEQGLDVPETQTRIMLNIASPAAAFSWWRLPCEGIGLARMEFIINNIIQVHPMALIRFDTLEDEKARQKIEELTRGYSSKTEYFIDHLARGIAKIAASQYPHQVIVRMSDFKTNEYADLIGGAEFEPHENNPMLGFRGASRYYSDRYREGFALECQAIRRVRDDIGLDNVLIMIPFCRTTDEADKVIDVLEENGLKRGEKGLEIYVMCEIPSNVTLADQFAERFDGFSIGSNDLTQLVLGVDRDSSLLAHVFDERNEAVQRQIADVIQAAHEAGRKVGICGQAPSDYPEFAAFLVKAGIDSISLNPDSVIETKKRIARAEKEVASQGHGA